MSDAGTASLWGALVLASLVVGAVAAVRLRLPERTAATITAFGGGTLSSAVAFDLVPEADELAGKVWTAAVRWRSPRPTAPRSRSSPEGTAAASHSHCSPASDSSWAW